MKLRFLLLFLITSYSCFAENIIQFRVEGKINHPAAGKYVYLQIFSNTHQKNQLIKVPVIDNAFVITGQVKYGNDDMCKARLFVANKAIYTVQTIATLLKDCKNDYRTIILDKKVTIEINGLVKRSLVGDGELNRINNLFENISVDATLRMDSIQTWYKEQLRLAGDDKEEAQRLHSEYMRLTRQGQDKRVSDELALTLEYPYAKQSLNVFGFVAALNTYMNGRYTAELEAAWDQFPTELKTKAAVKHVPGLIEKVKAQLTLTEGMTIPDYTFAYENDSTSIKDFRGKYLLLDFWTSWCSPCRAEHYNMKKAYEKYKTKNFEILQISLDDKKEKWLKALKEEELPWENLHNVTGWDKKLVAIFNFTSIPANYLVSPEGTIIARNLRGEDLYKKLAGLLGEEK